jgi:gliding motility-associated-like protein
MPYSIKISFLICFFSTIALLGGAQNLVQNGSFEDIDSCFGNTSNLGFDVFEWSVCKGWSNPIKSSPDLWCENPIVGIINPPQISAWYQYPRTGKNMVGIAISDPALGFSNYKEYIQNELTSNLNQGKTYNLKAYINLSYSDMYTCFISNFGVKFSSSKIVNNSIYWLDSLNYDVQNNFNNYFKDTAGWTEITLQYTADGSEKYMIFGSFTNTMKNNILFENQCDTLGSGITGGYFFIDDISLIEIPFIADFPNVFTPNNDGVNDSWTPTIISGGDWKIDILNRWGNLIATLDQNNPSWTTPQETDGVYFYRFYSKDLPNESRSGFIHLIR